jgi:hypothetical protein
MFLGTIEDGRCVLPDSRRERLGGTVVVAPVTVEVWMPVVVGMTGVISFRTTAPIPPYTVRGRARPIRGGGCRGGGPRGSQLRPRALHVPRARRKYAEGVGRSHAYVTGVGQGGDCSRRGARVGRFDDVMGARARRKPALSPGRLNS